jgi:hypothetical protein
VNDSGRRAGVRDFLWLAVTVIVTAAFVVGAGRVLWEVANNRAAMEVLWLPVGLICAGVLATLAWRRTVWGRPSG